MDAVLNGGLPENRVTLVTGGPGVGKSTLAMQYLQEGIRQGEDCLFVSTEQTEEELRTSFAPFDFDLEHPNLTVTSIHGVPSNTLLDDDAELALETLGGGPPVDGPFVPPFDKDSIQDHLAEFAPADRVVLDSVSGLATLSDDPKEFQRTVLDLIRTFTDDFEATTVFTAEGAEDAGDGLSDLLQFTTHGVIRLQWDDVHGTPRRFFQVEKMRGVDHDPNRYELTFSDAGIDLAPVKQTTNVGFPTDATIPTQIEGLDDLSGGLVRGHSVLLEYDGYALTDPLVARFMHAALTSGMCVWLITSPILGPDRLEALFPDSRDVEDLLDANRLFVLDVFSAWTDLHDHRNVFSPPDGVLGGLFRRSSSLSLYLEKQMAKKIDERRDRPMLGTAYTEALLRWLDPTSVKESYYWSREQLADDHDTGLFIHNPATMPEDLAEFFHSDAVQAFETTIEDNGIQYLRLNKSPVGRPGSAGVVDYDGDGFIVRES